LETHARIDFARKLGLDAVLDDAATLGIEHLSILRTG